MPLFPTILKDPALNLDKKQRLKILGQANGKWFKVPCNILLYFGTVIAVFLITAGVALSLSSIGLSRPLDNTIIIAVVFLLLLTTYYIIFNFNYLPHLYQELRNRGHDICPKCGYTHIELPDSKTNCPECGTPRSPLPTPTETTIETPSE